MSVYYTFVPGLPHLLQKSRGPSWERLASGYEQVAKDLAASKPDILCLYSSQWLSVLGTSFQCHPQPQGLHVDENWYDFENLPYDFKTDSVLAEKMAIAVKEKGLPTKTVSFESFPIDTGSLVALRFLNTKLNLPVVIVSSWAYANAEASYTIGRLMRETSDAENKRVAYIACSALSHRFSPFEVDPQLDAVAPKEEEWNQQMLRSWEQGDLAGAAELSAAFTKEAGADMQFNAFHWLRGVLGEGSVRTRVHAYGPIWGTGAAVVEFKPEGVSV